MMFPFLKFYSVLQARGPGMMIEVMEALVKRGFISLAKPHVESLVAKRMAMPLIRIGEGEERLLMGEIVLCHSEEP
jgi:hypothetical protein